MPTGSPCEPARGSERVIIYVAIAGAGLFLLIVPIAAVMSDAAFHPLQVMVPLVMIPLAIARLKGWIKRGSLRWGLGVSRMQGGAECPLTRHIDV